MFAALFAGGGSLVGGTLLIIWGIPDFRSWQLGWEFAVTFVTIGFLLILAALYVKLIEKNDLHR